MQRIVAVYARVSDADHAGDSSIPDQAREGEAFARGRWPEAEVVTFQEIGSAATIAKRPEFCKLLSAVAAGRVRAVVVRDQDRLSRETAEMLQLQALLRKHGAEAWCYRTGQEIQANDPTAKLMLTVMAGVSTFEREIAGVRTKARMIAMRGEGRWAGGHVPRGYGLEDRDGEKVLSPNGDAVKVRMIFEAAARSRSLAYATRQARELGMWKHKTGVQYALQNRVYAGAWRKPDGTWLEAHHEAIVPADLFEAAQLVARLPWHNKKKHQRLNMLQGLLHCTHCGRPLGVTHSNKHAHIDGGDAQPVRYYYYHCVSRSPRCPVKRIPAEAIEAWTWEVLGKACQHPRILEGAIKQFERTAGQVDAAARSRVAEIEGRLKELDNLAAGIMDWLCSFWKDGNKPPETGAAAERTKAIERERKALLEELAAVKPQAEPKAKLDAATFVKRLRERLSGQEASPQRRAAVIRALVRRIDVEANGDIHLHIAEPEGEALATGTEGERDFRTDWLPDLDSNQEPRD